MDSNASISGSHPASHSSATPCGRGIRGWRRTVAAAALGALCLAGTAAAQTVQFTFTGRGFGHGVGMSQYGAQGDALHGWSAAKILAWYYRGTSLTAESTATTIRVLLGSGQTAVGVGIQGAGQLVDQHTGNAYALAAGVGYTLRPAGSGVLVQSPGTTKVAQTAAGVMVAPTGSGLVKIGGRAYRGTLTTTSGGGRLETINTVPIESYLRGVVAGEMPSSWAAAALDAQAIASRSYALASRRPSSSFDVYQDTRSQMYGGVAAESAPTSAAVSATSGQAVTYRGAVVQAFFFSSSGGHTESIQDAWGGPAVSYLSGVADPYDVISPMDPWRSPPTFTAAQLGQLLGLGAPVNQIAITDQGTSPRVRMARVTLTNGGVVSGAGAAIQSDLGLPSTWFVPVRSPGGAPGPVARVSRTQIADYVVTHFAYARWPHAAALLVSRAVHHPGTVAAIIARGARPRPTRSMVVAFVDGRYAASRRGLALRKILSLSPARQIQILARAVFPRA